MYRNALDVRIPVLRRLRRKVPALNQDRRFDTSNFVLDTTYHLLIYLLVSYEERG